MKYFQDVSYLKMTEQNTRSIIRNILDRFVPNWYEHSQRFLPPDLLCMCIGYLVEEIYLYFESPLIEDGPHMNETLNTHGFMFDGKQHGEWRSWYYEDKPKVCKMYKGKLCGNLCEYQVYENGQKHGEFRAWYDVSPEQIRCIGQYENGVPNGRWRWWFKNGQPSEEETYKNNMLHGMIMDRSRW